MAAWLCTATAGAAAPVSARVAVGAALDRAGVSATVGARCRMDRWLFGIDLEVSPWIDVATPAIAPGTFNAYASATFVWKDFDGVELRSLVELGTSVLLFDAVGAPRGSTGIFAGGSLFSVAVHLTPTWTIDVTPDVIAMTPQLRGTPLVYREYRLEVGVSWTPPR